MRQCVYIILTTLTLTSCFNSKREPRHFVYRPEFDISNNDKNIVCTYYENDKGIIYQIGITNNERTRISPTSEYSFIKPTYSPDNKKIVCISESLTDNSKSKICLVDIGSKTLTYLTSDSLFVLECVFHPNGQSIYFTAAKYLGNYSPVATKAPHEIDVYSIDIVTKQIKQITNFNAYSLYSLSITNDGDSLLFRLIAKNYNGVYLMSINDKNLRQVTAANDLRAEKKATAYEYYSPILSRDNSKIAFSEPYELYIMDRKTRISKLIFRNESNPVNIGEAKFLFSHNYLMVSIPVESKSEKSRGDNFGFYTINTETNEIKTIGL